MQVKNDINTELSKINGGDSECPFDIEILKDGTWMHKGRPIKRMELVKLFSTVLSRDDDGNHWLITPAERGKITVEDSAYVSKTTRVQGQGQERAVFIATNIDQEIPLNQEHSLILKMDENDAQVPYLQLDKNLEARITRKDFYHLTELAETDPRNPDWIGLWSHGSFHRLGQKQ